MQQMETEDLAIILAGMTSAKQLHGFLKQLPPEVRENPTNEAIIKARFMDFRNIRKSQRFKL